jgi:tetratricopeptide (TPR) repeat protein
MAESRKAEADEMAWRILRVYEFLYAHVQSDVHAGAATRNAIRGRLGRAYMRLQKYAEAVPHLERALAAAPRSAELMRALALALQQTGKYGDAVAQWRSLAGGLERGSDGWFEAHYERLRCYVAMKEFDHAGKLLRYYLEYLHPEDAPAAWNTKFSQLQTELNAGTSAASTEPDGAQPD